MKGAVPSVTERMNISQTVLRARSASVGILVAALLGTGCYTPKSQETPPVVLDEGTPRPIPRTPKALDDLIERIESLRLAGEVEDLPELHVEVAEGFREIEDWRNARKHYRYALYEISGEPGLHGDHALASVRGADRTLAEECLARIAETHLLEGNARTSVISLRDNLEHFDSGPARQRAVRVYVESLERIGRTDEALAWSRELDEDLPRQRPRERRVAADVAVLPRSAWGPRPSRGTPPPLGRAVRITIHHSAIDALGASEKAAASQIQSIQRSHLGNRWDDIGYHFLIDPEGRTWEGRPIEYQGAHAGNTAANQGNIGICLLGNFEHGRPPRLQWEAMVALVEQMRQRFDIPRRELYGHREMRERYTGQTTLCPGRHLEEMLGTLRDETPVAAIDAHHAGGAH